jgi:hypothetical protein
MEVLYDKTVDAPGFPARSMDKSSAIVPRGYASFPQ